MSEHFARKCGGKRRYKSERKAELAARSLQHRCGDPMDAYQCEYCKGWHVGNAVPMPRELSLWPRDIRHLQVGAA